MDVDGVLTDGGLYYAESGDEAKRFDVRDGQGIVSLHAAGIATALVTKRSSAVVTRRARELGIGAVHQGVVDKGAAVEAILARHRCAPAHACYIGDDVGDLPAMRAVGVSVAVADAAEAVRRAATWVTRRGGGRGAVREVCDLILAARASGQSGRAGSVALRTRTK
jgi:3-deoxy-D-manno-octulosonate 8-phosphate phosphatase (KDO 8-P phosphatase)